MPGFRTRSNTHRPVISQKKARSLKFQEKGDCNICVEKTKALICAFVFALAKLWFSHDEAHILYILKFSCDFYFTNFLILNY